MTTNATIDTMQPCVQETQWDRDLAAAEAIMPEKFEKRCIMHLMKAMRKHPRFADALFSMWEYNPNRENVLDEIDIDFAEASEDLRVDERHKAVVAGSIISVKTLGAFIEYLRDDKAACVDELYDAVAVLMRMIAVVEGKQKLGGEK